jgi:2-polyprenyl-6-methoxyphenol hydroxylase-like FAD-dependent oxidoreductase
MQEVRLVDRHGRRVGGFSAGVFSRLTNGRFLSLPRGELAASIYGRVEGQVETIFGDNITGLEESGPEIRVRFEHAEPRAFNLVIGADGLHSNVRGLVFGEQDRFEKYLGYKVAAFEVSGYRPRDELVYILYTQVGQQVARFSMRGDRTVFLFVFADEGASGAELHGVEAQKALLRERFSNSGWECQRILEAMESSDSFYFDRVSQIRMNNWTKGRAGLVGDAAFCVSLLAGQGSALAMVAAYVLAGELKAAGGDHERAFTRYQERLKPCIAGKQNAAEGFAGAFAPRSSFGLFVRNQASKLLSVPFVANLAIGRGLTDKIRLPEY